MTKLKIGILGAGYIIDAHAKALTALPEVVLHAVCDVSPDRARAAASRYGIRSIFGSLEELASSDCDVVHVLVPPALHLDAARELIDAGKSVFIEKPMGLDADGCAELASLAERRGCVVGVNHNFLFGSRYELLRARLNAGALGNIDQLSVTWHFQMPVMQFGPYDSWMLAAPANVLFEIGSHLAAFVVDLVDRPEVISAVATHELDLPAQQRVYRKWEILCRAGPSLARLSISTTVGEPDRIIRVRGRGGSAQLDFGRDICWYDKTTTDNPILDAYASGHSAGRVLMKTARADRLKRLGAALMKRPDANPFEETIFRSISRFYQGGIHDLDVRHDARLATKVVLLCQTAASMAGVGAPSQACLSVSLPTAKVAPTILVVGGTGFIGKPLVRQLCDQGHSVRVLTRNSRAAAIELGDLPVELMTGSHGNSRTAADAVAGVRAVYHLAKCEGKRWQDYVEGDIEPTRVLAEAALIEGVQRFIYTGTIASYKSNKARDRIDNDTPVDPVIESRGHYARSKAACEALLQEMHRKRGLGLVILRPGIVIGAGSAPAHPGVGRFSGETGVCYWGDGMNMLPFVLVGDVVDALVKVLDSPSVDGKTLLLTSPPLLSAHDYVVELERHMGSTIDARTRSPWRYWISDLFKELAKNAVRHPNRRWPTLHDSQCQTHRASYDAKMTEAEINWHPVADRATLVSRGVADAVKAYIR